MMSKGAKITVKAFLVFACALLAGTLYALGQWWGVLFSLLAGWWLRDIAVLARTGVR